MTRLAPLALATGLIGAITLSGHAADLSSAHQLMASTRAADAEKASEQFEAALRADPDDFEARLGAAESLNQVMAIRTNGNLPLVDRLQDTAANKALWSALAPRALAHAKKALAHDPKSVRAAAAVATAYMFHASSLGILQSIVSGAGGEYRTHAGRLLAMDPRHEDGLADTLFASLYLVAPWPVGDSDAALEHFEKAATYSPTSVRNQYGLGVYWAREGNAAKARPYLDRVARLPCRPSTERLFCDWMKQAAKDAVASLD